MKAELKKNGGALEEVNWWIFGVDEVVDKLGTDKNRGLSAQEAAKRLDRYGENQLQERKKVSALRLFLHQFSSLIVWILIGALVISGFLGEWVDASAIGVIVILNALIGFYQEYRAERSLEALKKMTKPLSRVVRDESLQTVASRVLVPGDLVVLEEGDIVPADGRIIQAVQLSMQEASLTGESTAVDKQVEAIQKENVALGDRKNMAFMGTIVARGKGRMIVAATGMDTEFGKIASSLAEEDEPTPLQRQLDTVGYQLVIACLGVVGIVFFLGVLRGHSYLSMLISSLSLAVAAIPEGLPAVVTVALAIGVRRMAQKNAIVRRLLSVETLGSTSIICTDKTGTLTKNEMTVQKVWVDNKIFDVTGIGYDPEGQILYEQQSIQVQDNQDLSLALKVGVLCNGAHINKVDDKWSIIGDPTEGSLLVLAKKAGFEKKDLEKEYPLEAEIPFNSERKRMSMVRYGSQGRVLFVKGAADVIVDLSSRILIDGQSMELTEEHKKNIQQVIDDLASKALRILAVAYRDLTDEPVDESIEQNLIFVGLVAMIDPPREEAKKAIEKCRQAGIRTIMITGDHKETARAIGKELGLINNHERAITGVELDGLSDEELKRSLHEIGIYARTSADHKMRIVKAWQAQGNIVAVTGDGVNDAPAIKAADIGVAMGITGTEVSKEAADMVITDDNFASIVNAVEEGRGIYENIVKFVKYLLSANLAELLVIFIGTLFAFKDATGAPYVSLLPIQLLWLNLVTDGLPAIALAMDPIDPRAMDQKPRRSDTKIISSLFILDVVILGVLLAAGVLVACHVGLRISGALGHTMTLTSFVVLELVRVQMVRARYNISLFSNPLMILALLSSLGLQLCIVYTPFFQEIFHMVPLGFFDWSVILGIAIVVWVVGTLIERFFLTDNRQGEA